MPPTANFRIGLVQMHCTADPDENLEIAVDRVRRAAREGAQVICLPELFRAQYFCQREDIALFDLAEPIPGPSTERLGAVAREENVTVIASLFERRAPGLYHNTAATLGTDGAVASLYRKMHIPDDPLYYEKFYFTPGDLGYRAVDTAVGRVGTLVCWDQWYPEAARAMTLMGAEVLLYPTAIGSEPHDASLDTRDPWRRVMQGHAGANVIPGGAANRIGTEPGPPNALGAGQSFYGSSFIADHRGDLIAGFDRTEEGVLVASVDLDFLHTHRAAWGFFRDRRTDLYEAVGPQRVFER